MAEVECQVRIKTLSVVFELVEARRVLVHALGRVIK